MAANDKLEAFLSSEAGDNRPATEPQEAPKPEPQQPDPDKGKEPVAPSEPQQEGDDDEPVRAARPGEAAVPQAALIDERAKRHQWREEAARYKAQAEEREKQAEDLRKRLEALEQRQALPPQPQYQEPAFQWADPQTDPHTYNAQREMMQRANISEMMMRREIGAEATQKLIAEFHDLARTDPLLMQRVRMELDPYDFARREVERQRVLREVGDDPTSYEKRLREKWEAEQAAKTPAIALPQNTPPPNMPPSLASVRSAAPRGAPQWSGPLSDQQFSVAMREHRMAQRRG